MAMLQRTHRKGNPLWLPRRQRPREWRSQMGRHRGLPLPNGAMQCQTVGATPCGCPVGSARVEAFADGQTQGSAPTGWFDAMPNRRGNPLWLPCNRDHVAMPWHPTSAAA